LIQFAERQMHHTEPGTKEICGEIEAFENFIL